METTMPNNIAVSITADVADLTAKRAIMSAELKAATKDLNDFAKTARTGGMTDALRADMLKTADAVAKARAQVSLINTELKRAGSGSGFSGFLGNLGKNAAADVEGLASKVPLLGGALAALGPEGLAAAAGLAAATTAIAGFAKAADWAEDLERFAKTTGLSTKAVQEFDFVAQANGIPVASMRSSLEGLAETIGKVQDNLVRGKQGAQVKLFELVFGVDDPEKAKQDLRDMGGDIEGVMQKILDLSARMSPTQRAGLAQALKIDPQVLEVLTETRQSYGDLLAMADKYGVDRSDIDHAAETARQMHLTKTVIDDELRKAYIDVAPAIAGGAKALAGFLDVVDKLLGPLAKLIGLLGDLPHQAQVEGLPKSSQDLLTHMGLGGLVPAINAVGPGFPVFPKGGQEPQSQVSPDLLAQMHDLAGGTGAYAKPDPELEALIKALGQTGGGKGKKGPSDVSEWEEQLKAQEAASGEFFKDQTAAELAFWQSKLALTKSGSQQWLAVQEKIYEAQKTLAHQSYDEHLATIDAQLEADRDNWSKEQGDWQAKLDFIKAHYGAESKEYQDAFREYEAAEREHQRQLTEIAHQGAEERLDELKSSLATERTIREENARTAESQITAQGKGGGILGEVTAAQQIAALHKQLAQQEIADANATYAAENQLRQQDIARALTAYGQDSTQYQAAVAAKKKADLDFYNQHRVLENQMVNQEQQDAQRVQQAWHSIVDPMVQTTGNQIKGLIEGTETWGQALKNIGEEALSLVIDAIEHMVETWIINMITGQASTQTSAISQVAAYAAVAGAAGTASFAGAPFPIDLGAPEFGEAMAGTALGFGALAAAEGGFDVGDIAPLTQLHPREMVLPEPLAERVRNMTTTNNTTSRGGDFNAHFGGVTINGAGTFDGHSIAKALDRAHGSLAKVLKNMHRNGAFNFVAAR